VQDLSYVSRCCCNCCGTIKILSSDDTDPEILISGIPEGEKIFEKLRDAVTRLQSNARLQIQN